MRLTLLLCFSIYLFTLSSCKKYKPAEEAFRLKAQPVRVSATASQGGGAHNITDLGLYVNGQFMGSYPADAAMPVITNGKAATIQVQAGIKNNGIADTRVFWPFYETIRIDTFVRSGETISRPLTFSYASAVNFTWTETFESLIGHTMVRSSLSDSNLTIVGPPYSFEGRSLRMGLGDGNSVAQVQSGGNAFVLPKANSNVYIEMNYKCNEEVTVGLIDDAGIHRPAVVLNPQNNWNKVYISVAEVINSPSYSPRYRVYFRMLKKDTQARPEFFLDNLKLLFLP